MGRTETMDHIRQRLLAHLEDLGYTLGEDKLSSAENFDKVKIRKFYASRRIEREQRENAFVGANVDKLIGYFANGHEIVPAKIAIEVEEVESGSWQGNLFRLATLIWSVPVSRGYGRRIRFLVWDRHIDKLVGVIALGDPVFNLKPRDEWIGWNTRDREERLCNVLDAYILGAVPPYSQLIAGKLVAALVSSKEVNDVFRRKYAKQLGLISKKAKHPKLVLVTTTSALGRSSVYNRLRLDGNTLFHSVGFTEGWGHFHISDAVFQEMKEFLSDIGHKYANGNRFGNGPNWRMRVIRAVMKEIGISQSYLNHGIRREIFAVPLATNFREILIGEQTRARWQLRSAADIGRACVDRWVAPRAERDGNESRAVTREVIRDLMVSNRNITF